MTTPPRSFLLAVAALMACAGSGCTTDISNKAASYKIDYQVGTVLRTKVPTFLRKMEAADHFVFVFGWILFLEPPGNGNGVPETMRDFERGDKSRWPDIVDVLPGGTTLRVEKITREKDFELGAFYAVHAVLLEGAHKGKRVRLEHLSKAWPSEPRIDASRLETVQP